MSVLSRFARLVSPPQVGRSVVLPGGPGSLCCAWCPGFPGGATGARHPDPLHGSCPSPRTPSSPLTVPFPPAQGRSRRPRGSILVNQRGPTGLSVKSSPVAPPDRSVSSCRHSHSSASATVTECSWRGPELRTVRASCSCCWSHRVCREGESEACLRRR